MQSNDQPNTTQLGSTNVRRRRKNDPSSALPENPPCSSMYESAGSEREALHRTIHCLEPASDSKDYLKEFCHKPSRHGRREAMILSLPCSAGE
jgi:hypothetical protein